MVVSKGIEWTDEHDVELKRLLTLKIYSNTTIAEKLNEKFPERGVFTRNAVIGRINRIEKREGALIRNHREKASSDRVQRVKRVSPTALVFNTIKAMDTPEELPNPIEARAAIAAELAGERAPKTFTIDELRKGMCRWPCGEAAVPPYLYCGQTILRGSFCAEHCALAYKKPEHRNHHVQPSYQRRR